MVNREFYQKQVLHDLEQKLVFLGGPRQVGKTTLATTLVPYRDFQYLNWDLDEDRSDILKKQFSTKPYLIFDEIHKYKQWRNYIKGIYDVMKVGRFPARKILVTGSARLDLYRFSGDSLQGRYHFLRMHPLTFAEIGGKSFKDLENLLQYSGFPEPFLRQNHKDLERWAKVYVTRLIRDEMTPLEQIQDVGSMELLMHRLPSCVASPLSINNLREDLQVAHKTVARWLQIMERLYYVFRLSPFGSPKIKAVKQEKKAYLYDWSRVQDDGARFENLIAVHLNKYVQWLEDTEGRNIELRYFRDRDAREVDFVIVENNQPTHLIEAKRGDTSISPSLKYLAAKFPKAKAYQLTLNPKADFLNPEGIRLCSAEKFLGDLI